jgi:protein-tyrosine-phosphatase
MLEYGIDLSTHRSSTICQEQLAWADSVLIMDGGNERRLLEAMALHGVKVPYTMLGSYHKPPLGRIKDLAFISEASMFSAVCDQIVSASAEFAGLYNGGLL